MDKLPVVFTTVPLPYSFEKIMSELIWMFEDEVVKSTFVALGVVIVPLPLVPSPPVAQAPKRT
jgi:hypothetical protein